MRTFKQFLAERTSIPLGTNSVKADIKELKGKLWEQELSLSDIVDILDMTLSKYLICLNEVYNEVDSEYSAVGLNGGSIATSGWIEVNYTGALEEFMNGGFNNYYEDFVTLLSALIGHELTHREQFLKSAANFENAPDPNDSKKYLNDHRELQAYAVQAVLELLGSFDKDDILSKLKNHRGIEELAMYSEGVKWYVHTFDFGSKQMKKFLKKIYEILDDEDENV